MLAPSGGGAEVDDANTRVRLEPGERRAKARLRGQVAYARGSSWASDPMIFSSLRNYCWWLCRS